MENKGLKISPVFELGIDKATGDAIVIARLVINTNTRVTVKSVEDINKALELLEKELMRGIFSINGFTLEGEELNSARSRVAKELFEKYNAICQSNGILNIKTKQDD